MAVDILDLAEFYAAPRGQMVQRQITRAIAQCWTPAGDDVLVGYGYALPYAAALWPDGHWHFLMPGQQGVMIAPSEVRRMTALVQETDWPLRDASVNRVLMVHGLEAANQSEALLGEVWRVLVPNGRVIMLVPNRTGFWARRDGTPFGTGRPYSRGQLRRMVKQAGFVLRDMQPVLMVPPQLPVRVQEILARPAGLLRYIVPQIGGLWLVEAQKQLPAPLRAQRRQWHYAGVRVRPALSSTSSFTDKNKLPSATLQQINRHFSQ
jgi:SAM-dependent methyltransferase